jgi:Flp pilus assembly protein TadB
MDPCFASDSWLIFLLSAFFNFQEKTKKSKAKRSIHQTSQIRNSTVETERDSERRVEPFSSFWMLWNSCPTRGISWSRISLSLFFWYSCMDKMFIHERLGWFNRLVPE